VGGGNIIRYGGDVSGLGMVEHWSGFGGAVSCVTLFESGWALGGEPKPPQVVGRGLQLAVYKVR